MSAVDRLSKLPREILEYIAFLLCAQDPLGPPTSLIPLLLTSRSIHSSLSLGSASKTQLYAKLCRLKFDCDAVERRCGWRPAREELEGHLVQMCDLVRWIRKASTPLGEGRYGVDLELEADVEAQLLIAYVAMLDDDGRNRAQFKHAGIELVVGRYVRRRLYDGIEDNQNWPQPSIGNACALWVWWMFTTQESLLNETKEEKEEIIKLVFPYMANPFRYASALAPPTHFTLPLGPTNPVQKHLYTSQTAHGSWPLYPTLNTPRSSTSSSSASSQQQPQSPSTSSDSQPSSSSSTSGPQTSSSPPPQAPNAPLILYYFSTSPSFVPPLIAPAASLLYWSRREIHGFFRNPMLPATRGDVEVNERGLREGLTQGDLEEFNRWKSARLRGEVVWDWVLGHAVRRVVHLTPGQETPEERNVIVGEGDEPSREWDLDWSRARMCGDVFGRERKWRVGSTYKRGVLDGVWSGVQFTSHPPAITAMLSDATRGPDFNENNIFFGARPVMVRLKEHGFVRTPSTASTSVSSSSSSSSPRSSSSSTTPANANANANAKIPPAAPIRTAMTLTTAKGDEIETTVDLDASLSNAWFPGNVGSVRWVEGEEPLPDGVLEDRYSTASQSERERMPVTTFIVDGDGGGMGGLGGPVGKLEAMEAVRRGGRGSVYERYEKGREGVHERLVRAKEEGRVLDTHAHSVGAENVVKHPGCEECNEREWVLQSRKEKISEGRKMGGKGRGGKRSKREVGREVEEVFASVGLGKGEELRIAQRGLTAEKDEDEDEEEGVVDMEFDDDEEEDEEVGYEEDEDMDDVESEDEEGEGELELVPVFPSTSVPPSRSVSVEPHYDDSDDSTSTARPHSPTPDFEDHEDLTPTRPAHSPLKIQPCDQGVLDTLLTGDLSPAHQLAWGKSVWYGRVRPWDGLVGVLRVAYDRSGKPNAYMVYYGYVYGGDTWVGNWRYARGEGDGSVDPLVPGFESAFVMSRRG